MYSSKSLEAAAAASESGPSKAVPPEAVPPEAVPSGGAAPVAGPLTRAVLAALAAPFDVDAYRVTVRASDARRAHAIVDVELPAAAVRRRLDAVLGPGGYREAYAVVEEGVVRCDLTVGGAPVTTGSDAGAAPAATVPGVTRTGFGEGPSYGLAQADAFVAAAHEFGVGEQAAAVSPFHIGLEVRKEPDAATLEALRAPSRYGAVTEPRAAPE